MSISEQLEDLIESNASDFELSKLFKSHISDYKNSLLTLFERNQGKDFLVTHTKSFGFHSFSYVQNTFTPNVWKLSPNAG